MLTLATYSPYARELVKKYKDLQWSNWWFPKWYQNYIVREIQKMSVLMTLRNWNYTYQKYIHFNQRHMACFDYWLSTCYVYIHMHFACIFSRLIVMNYIRMNRFLSSWLKTLPDDGFFCYKKETWLVIILFCDHQQVCNDKFICCIYFCCIHWKQLYQMFKTAI